MRGTIPPFSHTPSWRGAQLNHRDKFTYTSLQKTEKVRFDFHVKQVTYETKLRSSDNIRSPASNVSENTFSSFGGIIGGLKQPPDYDLISYTLCDEPTADGSRYFGPTSLYWLATSSDEHFVCKCWAYVQPNGKVKVKLSLCLSFNRAPRHGGVLGGWTYSFMHSLTSALDGAEWYNDESPGISEGRVATNFSLLPRHFT
jgi:hypothetical protein